MKTLHRRCAGLDVHTDSVVCCVRITKGIRVDREIRSFGTTTSALLDLAEWLEKHRCSHVAMEATGVYWKPVWHILEGRFQLVLANAAHVKNVPGRKTDVQDAQWIADLIAHGLIRSSFVPPTPIQEVRDLTRTRKQLVREIVQHTQRIQKTLETANVKLASVISDVLGVTGRAVLRAMIDGEDDPEKLLGLKHPRIQASDERFVEALRGRVTAHHRFLLRLHLEQIEALERGIGDLDQQIERALRPFRAQVNLLTTIPGVDKILAAVILGEIGSDMSRFPTAGHLLSWAGLCPRNDESAGKRRSTRLRRGGTWLKPHLVQAAWGAVRSRETYLRAQYYRLRARRGGKKAIVAVAASMLTSAYHMLTNLSSYNDLGPRHFVSTARDRQRAANRLVRRLRDLGYKVAISPAA